MMMTLSPAEGERRLQERGMPHFAGLDVSMAETAICVIDEDGVIVKEVKVPTAPKAIVSALRGEHRRYSIVVLEAGATATWIYEGLSRAGLPVVCAEARHAHQVLKGRVHKTDRNDALGLAELARMGMVRPVLVKSGELLHLRSLLVARETLLRQRITIEFVIRGILRPYGHHLGNVRGDALAVKSRQLVRANRALGAPVDGLLKARQSLIDQYEALHAAVEAAAQNDPVCRLLMTAPGVGPVTSLLYRTTVGEPFRFDPPARVGSYLGLARRANASGASDPNTRISHFGHSPTRVALVRAAGVGLRHGSRPNQLNTWIRQVAARRGNMKAMVAGARKLSVILLMMWRTNTPFRIEPV